MNFAIKRPKELENWQSSVPEETVERAKKILKQYRKDFCSTANFIGVGDSDDKSSPWVGSACHANMSAVSGDCRDVLATENGRSRRRKREDYTLTKEQARPFLQWFLHESPYGFIILNRDDFASCEDYGFVLAGDAPTTLVQCACIISRHFYEVKTISFVEFNKLVERGIDPFIAYQLCFNSNISFLPQEHTLEGSIFVSGPGHRVSAAVTPEQMLHYYQGDIQNPLGATYKDAPSIYGSTNLFIDRSKTDVTDFSWSLPYFRKYSTAFHNFLLEKEGKLDKSAVYRPPNPFIKKPSGYNEFSFTCQQALTDVADYCQQYVKEHLENV